MIKRLTVLLFISLSTFINVIGQRVVTGRVIDENSKKGIKEAQVKLANRDTTVVTNVLGFFQIKADTSDYLLIHAVNYENGSYKVPATTNFSLLLIPKKEDIYLIVEEPSQPLNFDSFKKYLSNRFSCNSVTAKRYEIMADFVTNIDGSLKNVTLLENVFDKQCENVLKDLLTNSPNWEPARQNGLPVKQKHRIKILVANDKIENILIVRPSLDSNDKLTMHFLRNFKLPTRLKDNSETFEIYICFGYDRNTQSLNDLKLINCTDIELENEILRVIKEIPHELVSDLYPENKKIVQPIFIFVNSDQPRRDVKPPDGELQNAIRIRIQK